MTGFEPRISGVGVNHSINWATTTTQLFLVCCDWKTDCTILLREGIRATGDPINKCEGDLELNNIRPEGVDMPVGIKTCGRVPVRYRDVIYSRTTIQSTVAYLQMYLD